MSGARLILTTDRESVLEPNENIIVGNVALYGATSGEAYIKGMAGERFAVRNSGAVAVVEGVGAHGCEYMTGGRVVILGAVGRNFGAGMSGGTAYLYDPANIAKPYLNMEMILVEDVGLEDEELLRSDIRNHFKYTGSTTALNVLQDWDTQRANFIKIIPEEYKRALQAVPVALATV